MNPPPLRPLVEAVSGSVPGWAPEFPGGWIRPRLRRYGTVSGTVPSGYPAYARIFHPGEAQLLSWRGSHPVSEEQVLRWSGLAKLRGTTAHPLMQWPALLAGHRNPGYGEPGWQYHEPRQGSLPQEELAAISRVLAKHSPGTEITAGLWEGYAWIHGGDAVATLELSSWSRGGDQSAADPDLESGPEFQPPPTPAVLPFEVRTGPKLELPDRAYFLFAGALSLFEDRLWQVRSGWDGDGTPNLLWPTDRSWCLASEIDFDSTIVGGSADLIRDLLACPEIEALPVPADGDLTAFADHINEGPGSVG